MFSQSFREINQQVGGGEIDKGDYGEVSMVHVMAHASGNIHVNHEGD